MTTFSYSLVLNDSEVIVLHDALIAFAAKNNSNVASDILGKLYSDVKLTSSLNFGSNAVDLDKINSSKKDLFE